MNVNKDVSNKQEKRITKSMKQIQESVRRTPASGALWQCKSDVVSEHFRIECKTKVKPSKSITVQKEWVDKITLEALQTGKTPLLVISFGDGKDYVLMEANDFLTMAGDMKEKGKVNEDV
jgi:Holliday junction resolvase